MLRTLLAASFAYFLFSLPLLIGACHVQMATEPTKVYVDPSHILDEALAPNTTFSVTIKVDNIPSDPGVIGVEFKLVWNSSVLNAVDMEEMMFHEVMPESEWDNIWRLKHSFTADSVHYAYAFLDVDRATSGGYAPISGSHIMAKVTFTVKALGKTALHFEASKLGEPVPWYEVPSGILHQIDDGFFSNTPAPSPAKVYVDPPKISNVSRTPCNNFTISVAIINASSVSMMEFKLGFNASVLHVNSVAGGSLLPPSSMPSVQIDNMLGLIRFNVTLPTSLEGSGVVAEISLHVENNGTTSFRLYDSKLLDDLGQTLPHTTSDGEFNNILLAKFAIDPADIIDPTLTPPATFTVNVTIAEVRDLCAYEFNLTFDPQILICLRVEIHDVLNETNYVPNHSTDNANGFVYVDVTYYPPAIPFDVDAPTQFATMKFRVKTLGASNLTLTNTRLVDTSGQVTHQVYDGYFQSLLDDIALTEVSASPSTIYEGRSTNITVTLANQGNRAENFTLSIYCNSTLIATENIVNLAPNSNATLTATWNTSLVQWGRYRLSAQASLCPYETDVADNIFIDGIVRVKVLGDIDEDDIVDIEDAWSASIAFHSVPHDANWNSSADLNEDNIVDIYDVIILSSYYGRMV